MMRAYTRSITFIVACVLLSACGYFSWGYKYTVEPITNPEIYVSKLWMTKVDKGAKKSYLQLTPAAEDERIFVTDAKGHVTALNTNNGGQYWQVDLKQPITSGPGVGDGMVFVATADTQIVALSADYGSVLWRSDISNQVLASPLYAYDTVLVKTINGELIALDAKTGEQHWRYVEDSPRLILRGTGAPFIDYPYIISGFADGNLAVLTFNKGKLIWEKTVARPSGYSELSRMVDIGAQPIVKDGVIYVASYQGNISAIELRSGEILWQHKLSAHAGLAVTKRQVFVADSFGRIWAFDRETGNVLWRQNELDGLILTTPVVLDNYLVIADNEGFLHWLAQSDGRFVSRQFFSKAGIVADPIEYDGKVFVLSRDGMLVALQPKAISAGD